MIVSENVEELDYESASTQPLNETKLPPSLPFNILLSFKGVTIPIQTTDYVEEPYLKKLTIKGLMLTTDFVWLIESGEIDVDSIGIKVGSQPEVKIKNHSFFSLAKIKTKDMNPLSVAVNLSLLQTT